MLCNKQTVQQIWCYDLDYQTWLWQTQVQMHQLQDSDTSAEWAVMARQALTTETHTEICSRRSKTKREDNIRQGIL